MNFFAELEKKVIGRLTRADGTIMPNARFSLPAERVVAWMEDVDIPGYFRGRRVSGAELYLSHGRGGFSFDTAYTEGKLALKDPPLSSNPPGIPL